MVKRCIRIAEAGVRFPPGPPSLTQLNMKNKTVFILHGTGGHSQENWFPWLKQELENRGYNVFVPQFPNPEKPLLEPWLYKFDEYKQYINSETILIGHSLGGLFLLRILEKLDTPVKAAFFVGAPVGVQPIKFYEGDNHFSNGFIFNWNNIKNNANYFAAFHSDNDPYVSLGNGQELAHRLGIELEFVPNAGHFNAAAGYTEFNALLDKVNSL